MHPSWLPIAIALLTVAAIVVRPWRVPEWVWAVAGASAETICGAVGARDSWIAVAAGANVYAFLIGVLALAETARSQSVFVWLAGHAERLAAGSRLATLALVYGAGIVVTALLSNDTTVIALTPAAVALVATTRRSRRQFCTRHWALIWSRPRLRIRQPGCGIELVGPYTVRRRARAHFWLKRLTWSGSTANSRGKALRTLLAQSNGYQKYRDHIVKAYSRCRLGILRQRGL